jgi:hypothetical protein
MNAICPNCAGELVSRPMRAKKPAEVNASQVKRRIGAIFGG